MEQQSKTKNLPTEQSENTVYGQGYVYMGPLTPQRYDINLTDDNQYQFKVMLLGDSGVGKTCLLMRFHDETFHMGNFPSTVAIDYRSKVITLGEKKINLQIFDTAGQERFRSITQSYYRDADALLLLYDITSYSSFDNVASWLYQIRENTDNQVLTMLIGNKIDKSQRVVSREAGERLARNYQMNFLETSAKTGQNVELAFMTTAQELLDRKSPRNHVHLTGPSMHQENRDSCC